MKSVSVIDRHGPFHWLDARAKLVFTILMIAASFFLHSLSALSLVLVCLFAISWIDVGLARAMKNIAILLPMIGVMFIFMPLNQRGGTALLSIGSFTVVTREALDNFLLVSSRFLVISLVCSLVMQTTQSQALMLSLLWFHFSESATLVLTLALRFIPDISATFVQIRESQRLRLPSPDEVNERKRPFKSIFPTLVSSIVSSIRSIPLCAAAIDLRGYGREKRTHWKNLPVKGFTLVIHFLVAITVPSLLILGSFIL